MQRIGPAARRRRLLWRQHLVPAARARSLGAAAERLVGLHASDPATVHLSARARLREPTVAAIEHDLYEAPVGIRMHGMRRTLFVEALSVAPVVQAAVTRKLAVQERRRFVAMIDGAGFTDDAAGWAERVATETIDALRARGEATLVQLGADVPDLRRKIRFSIGKSYEGELAVGTRLLTLLGFEGRAIRGRPLGTWVSSQYRWRVVERLLPGGFPPIPAATARVELVRRWLAAFGPGTLRDLRWWSGLGLGEVRRALDELGAVEVALDDGMTGWVLPGDDEPGAPGPFDDEGTGHPATDEAPAVLFLPALDPSVMGWADRDFYLGPHGRLVFDGNGNAGPTVWWDGRVVGGWIQCPDGTVAWRLLEDIGADGVAAVEAEAAAVRAWIGDVRVTPRYRTAVERMIKDARR